MGWKVAVAGERGCKLKSSPFSRFLFSTVVLNHRPSLSFLHLISIIPYFDRLRPTFSSTKDLASPCITYPCLSIYPPIHVSTKVESQSCVTNAYSTRMRVDLINRRTTSHFFPSSATPCDKREERGEGYRWEARTKREDVYSRSSRVQSEEEQQLHLTTSRGSGLRQIKYFKLNRGKRESGREREREGGGRWQSSESGAFSLLICFSLRSLLAGGSSVFIIKDRN